MALVDLFKLSIITAMLFSLLGCTPALGQKKAPLSGSKEFKNYWYSGKAEITRYTLEQARYGEIHKGDAVLIFVTEDFNKEQQVKHERGQSDHIASVLKLNFTRKFFTGLYPYSMMSSIFTPVDYKKPSIKVTTSSQEWCGHTYAQLNLKNNRYKGQLRSYFQSEGDQDFTLEKAFLEDEIWTKIRLNPSSLPVGDIRLIPGSMFLRLKHVTYKVENAKASLSTYNDANLSDQSLNKYTVAYNDLERALSISFESEFPFKIVSWEERTSSGFGSDAKTLTTRAVKTHSVNSPYWEQHDLSDADLRKQLGLDLSNY